MVLQAAEDANAKGLDFKSGQLTSKEAQQLWERLDKDGIAEHLPDTEYAVNRYVIRAKKEKPDLAADLANMSDDDIRAAIASAAKPASEIS
ncbi:MAG: hypothetical protein IID33_05435 [Planctomycetes bacterium]|nr:hypothetical protein [Planctomycetota bacterium]